MPATTIFGRRRSALRCVPDLFAMTAPLMIRLPDGSREVMVERFRHPMGVLYFTPFWHLGDPSETVRLAQGEIRGDGPWKVGAAVVQVLGCHGSEPVCAAEFDSWRDYLVQAGDEYPTREMIVRIAQARGAIV